MPLSQVLHSLPMKHDLKQTAPLPSTLSVKSVGQGFALFLHEDQCLEQCQSNQWSACQVLLLLLQQNLSSMAFSNYNFNFHIVFKTSVCHLIYYILSPPFVSLSCSITLTAPSSSDGYSQCVLTKQTSVPTSITVRSTEFLPLIITIMHISYIIYETDFQTGSPSPLI